MESLDLMQYLLLVYEINKNSIFREREDCNDNVQCP